MPLTHGTHGWSISWQLPVKRSSTVVVFYIHYRFINASSNKIQYIYAICLECLLSASSNRRKVKCKYCAKPWHGGETLQIGTLYKYEIFAPFQCCQKRLNCTRCDFPILNINTNSSSSDAICLPHFSSYSEERECFNCKLVDYHFIKQLDKCFVVEKNTNDK